MGFDSRYEAGEDLAMVGVSPFGIDYHASEELLTDEERERRDRLRAFCEKEVA